VTERICRADRVHVQAFVINEYVSDVSKRRNCVAHLCLCMMVPNAFGERSSFSELERVKGSALFNAAGKAKHAELLTLKSTEHELLHSLDFTGTIEDSLLLRLAKQQYAIGL